MCFLYHCRSGGGFFLLFFLLKPGLRDREKERAVEPILFAMLA
jgi:hypothetical protein